MQAISTKQAGYPRATGILLAIAIAFAGVLSAAVIISLDDGQSTTSVVAPSHEVKAYYVPNAGEGLLDTARVTGVADSRQKNLPQDRLDIGAGRETTAAVTPRAFYHPGMGEGLNSGVGDLAVLRLAPAVTSDQGRLAEWDEAVPSHITKIVPAVSPDQGRLAEWDEAVPSHIMKAAPAVSFDQQQFLEWNTVLPAYTTQAAPAIGFDQQRFLELNIMLPEYTTDAAPGTHRFDEPGVGLVP